MLKRHMSTVDLDDKSEQLVSDLLTGESKEDTFRQLFHLHYRPVLSFFIRRDAFSLQECEDLTQETFLRVYRGIQTFRHEVRFKYWLFRIATNVYRSALERRTTAKRHGKEVPLESDRDADMTRQTSRFASQDPLEEVLDEERFQLLHQAMGELPEQMRRCLTLRIAHELKYREIAEVMQISIQTVKAHLFQGRKKLRGFVTSRYEKRQLKIVQD